MRFLNFTAVIYCRNWKAGTLATSLVPICMEVYNSIHFSLALQK